MEFLKKIILLIESFLTWCMAVIFKHEFDKKIYRFNFPEIWYSPWNKDNTFIKVYKEISSNTLISKRKLYDIFCIGRQLNRLGGNYLEVGSLQGGSAGLLATTFTGTEIVLWDNWGEPVEHDDYFVEKVYSEKDDLNKTRSLLLQVAPRVLDSCTFVNRLFPCNEVISAWSRKFSLVHFDIYDKEAFELGIELIWPRIMEDGIFIVSAYGSISLDALTKAVNEFVSRQGDCLFVQSQSGLGLLIKRSR